MKENNEGIPDSKKVFTVNGKQKLIKPMKKEEENVLHYFSTEELFEILRNADRSQKKILLYQRSR